MALLDQLFRLRGAPGTADRPVTLGALVDALPDESLADATSVTPSRRSDADAPSESGVSTGEIPVEPAPAVQSSHQTPLPAEDAPQISERRGSGTRFNPFATAAETTNGGPDPQGRANRSALGPCLDDPGLPPLQLQPQVSDDPGDRVLILGAPAPTEDAWPDIVLRQIEAPAIRLSPLKSPPRAAEHPPVANPRRLMLRLEIEAEASLDVVAFKQYAAKFPGVVKCVISNAGG